MKPRWKLFVKGDFECAKNLSVKQQSATLVDDKIYFFGGILVDNGQHDWNNDIHVLDINTFECKKIDYTGDTPSARWAHTFVRINENELMLYGGYAGNREYLSEMHIFDIRNNEWRLVNQKGDVPEGRSTHVFVKYNDHKWVMFGGRLSIDGERSNDVYLFDTLTDTWEKIETVSENLPQPRSSHEGTFIDNKLWIFAGLSDNALNDLWCFNFKKREWKQIIVDIEIKNTFGHSSYLLAKERKWLIFHGSSQVMESAFRDHLLFDFDTLKMKKIDNFATDSDTLPLCRYGKLVPLDNLESNGYFRALHFSGEIFVQNQNTCNYVKDVYELTFQTGISEDFENLMFEKKLTDMILTSNENKVYNVHQQLFEIRLLTATDRKMDEIKDILSRFSSTEVQQFIIWVYTGKYSFRSTLIFEELGIEQIYSIEHTFELLYDNYNKDNKFF
eukprot:Anaeramoba_flamelloidesa811825_209.p1 GENE.a811825_209~~a811825_209.p1  ORF type:complete len:445 (+),score=58.04 a811825_209:99-1433(+)